MTTAKATPRGKDERCARNPFLDPAVRRRLLLLRRCPGPESNARCVHTYARDLGSDTLGVGFLVAGMAMQTTDWTVWVRLGIIVIVLYVTGAVASHALARAALHDGEKPLLAQADGSLKQTGCEEIYPELGVRISTPLTSEQVDQSVVEESQPSNS